MITQVAETALTGSTRPATITPLHYGWVMLVPMTEKELPLMPGDGPQQFPTAPELTYLPALSYFLLRPQLLTRL